MAVSSLPPGAIGAAETQVLEINSLSRNVMTDNSTQCGVVNHPSARKPSSHSGPPGSSQGDASAQFVQNNSMQNNNLEFTQQQINVATYDPQIIAAANVALHAAASVRKRFPPMSSSQ